MYRRILHQQQRVGKTVYCILLLGICIFLGGCMSQNGRTGDASKASGAGNVDTSKSSGEDGQPEGQSKNEDDGNSGGDENCIEEIRERGYLSAGCKADVPGLGFYDEQTNVWSGLEIELAYQTAAAIFDVSLEEAKSTGLVHFTQVTVADREEKLEKGEVDCLFATYTITNERKKRFAFSDSYYTDYIGLMVKTQGDNPNSLGNSEIRSIADLDGKYVGVPKNATTRKSFLNYIETMNSLKVSPIFMEYEGYEGLFRALKKGDIDVMAVDVSILNGYVDPSTRILNDRFGGQHYGAAVRKEDTSLLDVINQTIRK